MELIAAFHQSDISTIQRIALVCGNDPTRPALHHLVITPRGECGLVFTASNGVSIACAKLSVPFPHGLLAPIYLTPSAAAAIKKVKINKKNNAMLCIYIENGEYSIVIDDNHIKTQFNVIDGLRYPAWGNAIPSGDLKRPESVLFDDDVATLGTKVLSPDDKHKFHFSSMCLTVNGSSRGVAVAYNDGIMFAAMPIIVNCPGNEYIEMVSKHLLDLVKQL